MLMCTVENPASARSGCLVGPVHSDAAMLRALLLSGQNQHCALNPVAGLFTNDLLEYKLLPMLQPPWLVVCGVGDQHVLAYALPLSATTPLEWVTLPDKHARFSCVVQRSDNLLLTGGVGHGCTFLSSRCARWSEAPCFSDLPRRFHCSVQLGTVSVVCGGTNGSTPHSSVFVLSAGADLCWQRADSMLHPRFRAGGAIVCPADPSAHKVCIVGGSDSRCCLDTAELFDAVSNRWLMLSPKLSTRMWCHAAPVSHGAVLVVQSNNSSAMRCELLDIRAKSSCLLAVDAPFSPARCSRQAVAAVGEHTVAVIGGENSSCQATSTVQIFDARANSWSVRDEWHLPAASIDHCAAVVDT